MKENKIILYFVATALAAFGLLTLYLSSSVIFDLFNVRNQEGHYVLFIVWANFLSSLLYLTSSFGLIKRKLWAIRPINYSFILLLVALSGLYIHIETGGTYEIKTVYGMIFRITLTLLFVIFIKFKTSRWKKHSF